MAEVRILVLVLLPLHFLGLLVEFFNQGLVILYESQKLRGPSAHRAIQYQTHNLVRDEYVLELSSSLLRSVNDR